MIHENLLLILVLFFAMAILYILSQRFKISYPIFLVIGGLAISFIPGIPNISVTPDLIFLIFLPPLLFEASWYISWNQFWRWRQPVFFLGFGLVILTSCAIAFFSSRIIPGFTLALGFLLGGIISPPDAVAATSVLKGLKIPKRGLVILEGESLVNDAASLTVFRFATAAVITSQFVLGKATVEFMKLAVMGIFVGLTIGHILYFILRYWARASNITTPITLIAPYIMYLSAEYFHWSGVLAVVSGGLFLSFRSSDFLNYHTRMQTKEVWATVGFLLNGFVFILIGLELPAILSGLENYAIDDAIRYAIIICGIVISARIVLVYIALLLPRLLSKRLRSKEKGPGIKLPFIIGWAGMRGVVSLASALAIPLTLEDGQGFPHRNLILFITFVVILVTLIFQGLTLPFLVRWFNLEELDTYRPQSVQVAEIRILLMQQCISYIDENYQKEVELYKSVQRLRERMEINLQFMESELHETYDREEFAFVRTLIRDINRELIKLRRRQLNILQVSKKYDDSVIRDIEYSLDLEEANLSTVNYNV